MSLYTLRKNISYYMEQNKSKYFLLLLALAVGLTAGVLFACSVSDSESTTLTNSLNSALVNINSKSRASIFISFLQKNLRCISAVLIGAMTVYLLPVLFINMSIWGFSIGFTAGFITLYFGVNGFFTSVCLVITQVVFMIPAVMLLSVTAIDCTLHNIRNKKHTVKQNRKKLLILCILAFVFLMIISLIDIFAVPHIINAVSALK